jgi:D-aminoacyl-tRNA deacylase
MRAVVQRVSAGAVSVDGEEIARIGSGFVVLVGVGLEDGEADAQYLADKIINLRVFDDPQGKMNLSVRDVGGELLVVSQFTLMADCRKGRRPGFDAAATPEKAQLLYNYFVGRIAEAGVPACTGRFQAHMLVEIANDGPVTTILDSR